MYYLTDFKGFEQVGINLLRPFTLLIGPNGSGKTNVIEAVELLSFIARGQPLYEVADVGRTETGIQIRGGLQACSRVGRESFKLGFSAYISIDRAVSPIEYQLHIGTKSHPQILGEEFEIR